MVAASSCAHTVFKTLSLRQVVAGAGAVDHAQLVDLAGQAFSELPSGGPTTEELVKKVCRPWAAEMMKTCNPEP